MHDRRTCGWKKHNQAMEDLLAQMPQWEDLYYLQHLPGDDWYVLSNRWWDLWKDYTLYVPWQCLVRAFRAWEKQATHWARQIDWVVR